MTTHIKVPGIHPKEEVNRQLLSYNNFRKQLKAQYPDHFVTDLQAYQSQDGLYTTWCTWSGFIPTVMPQTDYISIVISDLFSSNLYYLKQEDLVGIAGQYLEIQTEPIPHIVSSETPPTKDLADAVINRASFLGRRSLLEHIEGMEIPAKEKYFIKLWFHSLDPSTQEKVVLFLHQGTELPDDLTRAQYYASKVNPGETLKKVLDKEVEGITGSTEYGVLVIKADDTAQDKRGNELQRYAVHLDIPHFDTKGKSVLGLNMSWCPQAKIDKNLKRE